MTPFTLQAETPHQLFYKLVRFFVLDGDGTELGLVSSKRFTKYYMHDVLLTVDRLFPNDLNAVLSGYTFPARFNKFLREYIEPETFRDFLTRSSTRLRSWEISGYNFVDRGHHRMGSCVFGLSIHKFPRPTIVLHSRATNAVPTGALDLSFVAAVAKYVIENGHWAENFEFQWKIDFLWVNSWKMIIPYYMMQVDQDPEVSKHTGRMLDYINSHIKSAKTGEGVPKLMMHARAAKKYVDLIERGGWASGLKTWHAVLPEWLIEGVVPPVANENIDDNLFGDDEEEDG